MAERLVEALQLSEEILIGIEMETLSTSSAALRCLRLARLTKDSDSVKWLENETNGCFRKADGSLDPETFILGYKHGRGIPGTKIEDLSLFGELADELEAAIQSKQAAIGTLTTQGVSVSGEWAAVSLNNLSQDVQAQTNNLLNTIQVCRRHLAILRGEYYKYAASVNLELKFSQRAENIFLSYRLSVDRNLIFLAPESLKKLDAAYERLSSKNPESWSQALTSCRRVFQDLSEALFDHKFKGFKEHQFVTKSGKLLDISGDHYLNKLFAVLDSLDTKRTYKSLVGSHLQYVIEFINSLHNELCKGVHSEVTFEEARSSILHTYICLGDISLLLFSGDATEPYI